MEQGVQWYWAFPFNEVSLFIPSFRQTFSKLSTWITKGYHCTIDLLFDWFGISCMTTDNFCFYLQNRLIQTSQTGGQQYNDTSPLVFPAFSIEWLRGCFLWPPFDPQCKYPGQGVLTERERYLLLTSLHSLVKVKCFLHWNHIFFIF